jgi:predicted nuclease of predicted toxin-antitoxin system
MRLLADENFPLDAVKALRNEGHDVVWIREVARGIGDEKVLSQAQEEERIVITFDKDFGELAFHSKLPATAGIILFRVTPHSSQHVALVAVQAIESRKDWEGHFSVIEDDRIRMTPLPKI